MRNETFKSITKDEVWLSTLQRHLFVVCNFMHAAHQQGSWLWDIDYENATGVQAVPDFLLAAPPYYLPAGTAF